MLYSEWKSKEIKKISILVKPCVLVLFCIGFLTGCNDASKPEKQWTHAVNSMYSAAISIDGHFAVVSSINHGTGYWGLAKNQRLYTWSHGKKDEQAILHVAISSDNSHVVTADKNSFVVWDTLKGTSIGYWKMKSHIKSVAISNRGRYVLIGLVNDKAQHIDLLTGRRLEFLGHEGTINYVDLSSDGKYALTMANDYKVLFWNTKTAQVIHSWQYDARIRLGLISPSLKYAFISVTGSTFDVWDLNTGKKVSKLEGGTREGIISAAAFSKNEERLVTGSADGTIRLWQVSSGKRLQTWLSKVKRFFIPNGAIIYAVGFSHNQQSVITEASSGKGQVWKID
ncbi:MAG: hypothetical protein HON94_16130 [Methylococcales bacterium]|nr:hypothetical protein [Methylococcales bacterium]